MKAILIAALMLLASTQAMAVVAHWTGQMNFITTVTYKSGISCEYMAWGNTFWKTFTATSCPATIEVQ